MGYRKLTENESKYQPRKGLEGPFYYPSGAVLYYDVREGKYWDPRSDFYVDNQEVASLKQQIFDIISR
jgi:hypothetical protein